ncbi:MAG: hypothetical protein OXB98_02360 [Bryobacterales bacterium]|nr:hypothetical protein [Bryobacterales bacterium]
MSERLKGVESLQDTSLWRIPEPLAVCEAHGSDGTPIMLRRHGNPEGPRLVLSHANGFAADAYYPFWSLLCDRFDLVLYDLRNHGWNPVGDLRRHNIPTFVRDNSSIVRAIDRCFGVRPKIGVFHSSSVLQSVEEKEFSALVLFDPATCANARESHDIQKMSSRMAERARKRQDRFERREELTERLLRSRAFERLLPGAANLIARTTLRRVADGRTAYHLCCPREYEAQVFKDL